MRFYGIKFLVASLLVSSSLMAACQGKVDVAPAMLKMNMVESGKTVRTRHLVGGRVAVDHFIYKAFLGRVTGMVAGGDSQLQTYTAGVGFCIPYKDFYFNPMAGATYTKISSPIDIPQANLYHLKEKFSSIGPYVGMDVQWCFHKKWRIAGGFQWSWSHTHAKVKPIFKGKSNSMGPTYTALLERDITDKWSINLGAAYNRSLSHEKHGVKLSGLKLGVTYWY